MIYHNFALQPGYVENSCLCQMLVSHVDGFPGIEEAMEYFRLTLVAWLLEGKVPRTCCAKNLKNKSNRWCSQCGTRLDEFLEPSAGEVQDAFMKMPMTTVDEGADMIHFFEERGWILGLNDFPDQLIVSVRAVARWTGREDLEDRPYLDGDYPDGSTYCSFRK